MFRVCVMLLITVLNISPAWADEVYDRVMRTGTIECGYFIEAPFTMRDERTGEFSGISVELVEGIAADLGLKVKWKEQISFATFPQDLNHNKYDMVCGSVFVMPRAGQMDYTSGYAQISLLGYVRPDDMRFDQVFDNVDWSEITIAGLDGEGATTAAQKMLPQAKMQVLPQLSNISEMLMSVSSGKADIGFVLPSVFETFEANNPGRLKLAELDKPLYSYEVAFGLPRGAHDFKAMINNMIRMKTVSGELEGLRKKYGLN